MSNGVLYKEKGCSIGLGLGFNTNSLYLADDLITHKQLGIVYMYEFNDCEIYLDDMCFTGEFLVVVLIWLLPQNRFVTLRSSFFS